MPCARALALIMAGRVYVGTRRIEKAAELLPADVELSIKGKDHDFVSRGALKLQAGLDHFVINPAGKICLDVGASTGGFTEGLLGNGASMVFAIDVGREQLHPSLRGHPRIVSMEETDIRTFVTLIRFDAAYHGIFKTNRRQIADYPRLSAYMARILRLPGVRGTVNMDHITRHYHFSHPTINPPRIVPIGPVLDFWEVARPDAVA